MTTTQQQPRKSAFHLNTQGKTLISAIVGAMIGCGASLHTYYSILGGSDQNIRMAQIELTVEHNRKVVEETLAILKQNQEDGNVNKTRSQAPLSKKPTEREFDQAIDGLFEGLDTAGADESAQVAQARAFVEAQTAKANSAKKETPEVAGAGASAGAGAGAITEAVKASGEAAGK